MSDKYVSKELLLSNQINKTSGENSHLKLQVFSPRVQYIFPSIQL